MIPTIETYLFDAGLYLEGYIPLQSLQSTRLDEYLSSIPPEIADEYTRCEAEYDCAPIVQQAVKEIDETCEEQSLKGWINCAIKYLNNKISYDRKGGKSQCGEKASEILIRGKGNCVDYTTVFVALCRVKGIPAYNAAVCIISNSGVECELYQKIRPLRYTRLGGMKYPKAHAIALVYYDGKWTIVDPTFELGLTRKCYGYSPILEEGKHTAVCAVPFYKAIKYS